MIALFNEYMQCFSYFVTTYFNKLEFTSGISIGWMLLTITCAGYIILYLYGRFRS